MVIQSSMGSHKLDVRYGNRNDIVYFNGKVDAAILGAATLRTGLLDAGRVVSLTTNTTLVPGILATATSTGAPMPFFAISGYDDNNYPDVYRTRGMPGIATKPVGGIGAPASPGFYGIPVNASAADPIAGVFATIAWKAAVELSTTEFNTAGTFTPGQPLTAVASTASSAELGNRGKLRALNASTDVIVGFVAPAAKFTGPEGYLTLAFYPTYIPGTTVATTLA